MAMREKALSSKTLVSFLQGLEGKNTVVELRDGTTVKGTIDGVDGYMNVEMSDVTYEAASGIVKEFLKYCCQGKFIRYVQIPEDVDPIETIQDRLDVLSRMRIRGRGRGRGGGRGFSRGGRGGRGGGGGFGGRGGRGGGGGGSFKPRPSYSGYGSSGSYGR